MKHHEMMLITDFRLHLSPLVEEPKKILDLGTGTGMCDLMGFMHLRETSMY